MNTKSAMMLRLLLNRYHSGRQESLAQALPEDERKEVLKIAIESGEPEALILQPFEEMKRFHYSWYIEPLRKVDKQKLPLILALFDEKKREKLAKYLNVPLHQTSLSAPMKRFLFDQMLRHLKLEPVLPIAYLPTSEMSKLADLKKEELIELIDYLGLYDLSEEIHHIVNKRLLEQIYAFLSKRKLAFVKQCLRQKEKLVTQRLQLENWDGNRVKLVKLLHHKGIIRLGYALSGENRDLLWHITHTLDTGRGEKLSRFSGKEAIAGVTETLKKQVKSILTFFKQASET